MRQERRLSLAQVRTAAGRQWTRLGGRLLVLTGLLAAVVSLTQACSWMRTKPDKGQVKAASLTTHPAATATPTPITAGPSKPRPTPVDGARPGNPAAWGEEAQIAVGRQFEPVYFDAGNSEVNLGGRQRLKDYAQWLREHPRVWIALAGHADTRGTVRYAYSLGMARALAVQDFLVGQGLDRQRFFPISFGEEMPADAGKSDEAQALNNRVELMAFIAPIGEAAPADVVPENQASPRIEGTQQAPPTVDIP